MRILAASEESVVFVANLGDLEQATLGANVGVLEVFDAVDNVGACGSGDAVIVRFADTANGSDVGFDEIVLRQI